MQTVTLEINRSQGQIKKSQSDLFELKVDDSFSKRVFVTYTVRIPWLAESQTEVTEQDMACYIVHSKVNIPCQAKEQGSLITTQVREVEPPRNSFRFSLVLSKLARNFCF